MELSLITQFLIPSEHIGFSSLLAQDPRNKSEYVTTQRLEFYQIRHFPAGIFPHGIPRSTSQLLQNCRIPSFVMTLDKRVIMLHY